MKNVVSNILKKENNEIDCTGCIFFSKCNLRVLSKIIDINKFIKEFKKIKNRFRY